MSGSRTRTYQGYAILSGGFRPFFFFGALYAGLSILLWLPQFYGELSLLTLFVPVDWHIHELYFGYLSAVITGFLLTAVPNWTGRLPLNGLPLLCLLLVWMAGRIAIAFSAYWGWEVAMIVDAAFLFIVIITIAREIIAGKNWRNLKVLLPLILLGGANISFHLEAHFIGVSDLSRRLCAAAVLVLIMLIGGRIIPSFTRNWLSRENPGRLPISFSRFDAVMIAVAFAALVGWIAKPDSQVTGGLMMAAGLGHIVRLARWAGHRTFVNPLVLVMHLSYFFLPVGFLLIALSIFLPNSVPSIAGVHALTVGAIGGMTLSIMVRATLGHTGKELQATNFINLLFVAIFVSALARIAAGLNMGDNSSLLHIAAFAWFAAFCGFSLVFARPLFSRR